MLDPWFQRAPERRLKALRNWLYWKLIENRIVRHASAMLFTCEEELRLARQTFRPYRPKREINVGFGVHNPPLHHPDMEKAFVESCPGVLGKPYLLFLGRIHPKKGVDLLIKAYSSLSRLHERDLLPKIVIAGPSLETPYGQSMKKLAAEICPPDSFFWPGMLVSNQKWGALYNCEASILPSHQENFGVAVVETLACDRPVLISNQVNIWRELKEAGAALVQDDSVEGTAQMLTDWIKLSSEAKLKMTVQAKNCFESNFSIESATRRLLAALTPEAKT
jgi:glycosyltransferase involved in cell wall biosynthesis